MTIETSSGKEQLNPLPSGARISQPGLNAEVINNDQEISDVLGVLDDTEDTPIVLDTTTIDSSRPKSNSLATIEVVQSQTTANSPHSSTSATSRNVNSIRKTIAKWLRLQRGPHPKSDEKKQNHGRSRYKLTGWPPQWVRQQSHSPEMSSQKQRALPPVPQVTMMEISAQDPIEDLELVSEPRSRSTPEIRPEDFPPGVAYLPDGDDDSEDEQDFNTNSKSRMPIDIPSTIKTVKNCDWYWGPICGDAAEQVLQQESDGSFLVRDSSDDRHLFSLTFKLNGTVRHVRIERDQGNFSFGSFTRFKSHTIVDFVENAVEHSRSGRYLFFLNRRLPNGPMRVQLLYPVSRVKKVQSLQHMCRFVILKLVPRDHVDQLPVPKRIKDYLKTPNYYSENIAEENEEADELVADAMEPNQGSSIADAENTNLANSNNPDVLSSIEDPSLQDDQQQESVTQM